MPRPQEVDIGRTSLGAASEPGDLVLGPDGNMWVTQGGDDRIAEISPSGAVVGQYPTPGGPDSITVGPEGALWYTLSETDSVGRITTAGAVTTPIVLPALPDERGLGDITLGADGNFWFTETDTNAIGRATPTGAYTPFAIPTPNADPSAIIRAPDGNVWFTEGIEGLGGGPGKVAPASPRRGPSPSTSCRWRPQPAPSL